jgi:hypothetical protein
MTLSGWLAEKSLESFEEIAVFRLARDSGREAG